MSIPSLSFRTGSANAAVIRRHLEACSSAFVPPLDERVSVGDYAMKLAARATTFEAWDGEAMIALAAIYLNDPLGRTAFLTSISVAAAYRGRGIGRELLRQCIARIREVRYRALELEVSPQNVDAVRLYESLGFNVTERRQRMNVMRLVIGA